MRNVPLLLFTSMDFGKAKTKRKNRANSSLIFDQFYITIIEVMPIEHKLHGEMDICRNSDFALATRV